MLCTKHKKNNITCITIFLQWTSAPIAVWFVISFSCFCWPPNSPPLEFQKENAYNQILANRCKRHHRLDILNTFDVFLLAYIGEAIGNAWCVMPIWWSPMWGEFPCFHLVPRKLRAEALGVRMVQFQGLGVYINESKSVQAYHIGKTLPTKNNWTVKPSRGNPWSQTEGCRQIPLFKQLQYQMNMSMNQWWTFIDSTFHPPKTHWQRWRLTDAQTGTFHVGSGSSW